MKTVISIDPGKNGGIAWKYPGYKAQCVAMPAGDASIVWMLRSIFVRSDKLAGFDNCVVYLENIVKHMGAGIPASTMAVYASNWGVIKGACIYAGVVPVLVTPQLWQKELGLGITGRKRFDPTTAPYEKNTPEFKAFADRHKKQIALDNSRLKSEWKRKLCDEAKRLFPDLAATLGTADALLILQFALRKENQ